MSDLNHATNIGANEKRGGANAPRPQNETGFSWETQKAYEVGFK